MINFFDADEWNPDWEQPAVGRVFVDLRNLNTKEKVVQKIGSALRGTESMQIPGGNLDALGWVVGDWFDENWGNDIKISIAGGSSLLKISPEFALLIVAILNDAFLGAIYNISLNHGGHGIVKEMSNKHIYLCMN